MQFSLPLKIFVIVTKEIKKKKKSKKNFHLTPGNKNVKETMKNKKEILKLQPILIILNLLNKLLKAILKLRFV
jgi:hypothetical protein